MWSDKMYYCINNNLSIVKRGLRDEPSYIWNNMEGTRINMEGTRINIQVEDYVDIGLTFNQPINTTALLVEALKELISMLEAPKQVDVDLT